MTGVSESVTGEKDGGTTTLIAQIPVGWQRKVEDHSVVYVSPSHTVLRSVDEVRVYLRTDGTCKCGLECPLVPNKVFNFDPAAKVQTPAHQYGKVEEDMTKLCNHRRKVDAMAALCKSMRPPQLPPLGHATGVVSSAEPQGTTMDHGDATHCTYSQQRHNTNLPLSSTRSHLQNSCVPVSSEQTLPLKKPLTPVLTKPWSSHPVLIQRKVQNPTSATNVHLSSSSSISEQNPSIQGLKPHNKHVNNSFPASSLLSAAAKAQLANQKSQTNPDALTNVSPIQAMDKELQPKASISTLNTSVHSASTQAPALPQSPASPTTTEKIFRRKTERCSPVLPKEPQSPNNLHLDNHRLTATPQNPSLSSRMPESEDGKKFSSFSLNAPPPSQPLSALLQLLSMQKASDTILTNRHTNTLAAAPLPLSPPIAQPGSRVNIYTSQHNSTLEPTSHQTIGPMANETTVNLKSGSVLNLSQSHTNPSPSISCSPSFQDGHKATEMSLDHNTFQINPLSQSNHNQLLDSKGPVDMMEPLDSSTRLLTRCEAEHALSLPVTSDLSDPALSLPLAEAFPFMSQEQLLQLLSSYSGLPSLLPPFLGTLPLGLFSQPSVPAPQNQHNAMAGSPLNLGAQAELPLNLVGLLNPPSAALHTVEGADKPPGLQAILMASMLLGQNPAALLPVPALGLELQQHQHQQHQVFGDGESLEKPSALLDQILMGPGILEALQTLAPPPDGQSLLLSTPLTPPPPTFLSLSPALLAAALTPTEPLTNHTQGSAAVVSTSCGSLSSSSAVGPEVCEGLSEQDKNSQSHHLLSTLLAPGLLGDLTSLQGLLGTAPLLLQPPPPQNPLSCLQLTMAPGLMGEKLASAPQDQLPNTQISQDSQSSNGLFDPYGSFMDTIYTSFLQVSERGAESGSDPAPLSFPELQPILQQTSSPPSMSPRHACSLHNPDLICLGMDAAQSPARGTPKLPENPSTPPPSRLSPSEAPSQPAFMEEANTKVCVYSNGVSAGREEGRVEEGEEVRAQEVREDEEEVKRASGETTRDTEQPEGTRRGRKRKQTLQRGSDLLGSMEEPSDTMVLSRPVRGKRRRMVR